MTVTVGGRSGRPPAKGGEEEAAPCRLQMDEFLSPVGAGKGRERERGKGNGEERREKVIMIWVSFSLGMIMIDYGVFGSEKTESAKEDGKEKRSVYHCRKNRGNGLNRKFYNFRVVDCNFLFFFWSLSQYSIA